MCIKYHRKIECKIPFSWLQWTDIALFEAKHQLNPVLNLDKTSGCERQLPTLNHNPVDALSNPDLSVDRE